MTSESSKDRSGSVAAPSPALALAAAAGEDTQTRDRFIAQAVSAGDSVATIAEYLDLSRQQVHAILESHRQLAGPQPHDAPRADESASAWRATEEALESLTSGEDFERLVHVLLQDIDPAARPLGGVGDRARDAASDLGGGDGSIFSISIERQWTRKIKREVARILEFGYRPAFVYGITNRRTSRVAEHRLEEWAKTQGVTLRILGQRWLVSKLMHPAFADLRREYLHLGPVRPTVFLDPAEYRRLLDGRPSNQGLGIARVGSSDVIDRVRAQLDRRGRVVLYGAGGLGKTRLVLDLAERAIEGEEWRFLDDLTSVRQDALGELGHGTNLVVVIDNAHRRRDLEHLLALLERREPRPKIVFVVRPARSEAVEYASRRVWLGSLTDEDFIDVRRLANRDIAQLMTRPPFELQYEDAIRAIVDLAEGNPLIAVMAGGLARDGRSIAELSRAEVFQQYVSGLLASLTERSPEPQALQELLAIVAALGALDRGDEDAIQIAAELLGYAPRAVRRWINELADMGLVIEDQRGRFAIKPDLLAEHMLVSAFFSERWRPTLPYADVLDAYAGDHLLELCVALGRVPYGQLNARHAGLKALRARCQTVVDVGPVETAAELVRALLPGAEDLALPLFLDLVERIEDAEEQVSADVGDALVEATQRVSADVAEGWSLLLRLAAAADDEVFATARDAMQSIYQRVPVHSSDHDGRVLAMVQDVVASRTRTYTRHALTLRQRQVAAAAGQALLTVTFERSVMSVENGRQLQLRAYALPASAYTESALDVGIDVLIETFPHVDDGERLRMLTAATALARHAAGFPGAFGIKLDADGRMMANRALLRFDQFIHTRLTDFRLPIQAEALRYVLARRDWQDRTIEPTRSVSLPLPPRSPELDDYLLLAHPTDIEPPSDRLSWQEEQQAKQAAAIRIAERLLADDEWRTQLQRWSEWQNEANVVAANSTSRWFVVVFTEVATRDPGRATAVVDYLVDERSELRLQLGGALNQLFANDVVDDSTVERWLAADEAFRATLASAIGDVESDLGQSTFQRLADDPSDAVGRGVLNGLRYGRSSSIAKIRLGLSVASRLRDIDALQEVLIVAELGAVTLTEDLISHAQEVLLSTAEVQRVDEHDLLDAIQRLQPYAPHAALTWAWRRIEWLTRVDDRAWSVDAMPGELAASIRAVATKADVAEALRRLEMIDVRSLSANALVDLMDWIDPAADEITEFVVRHYHDADGAWRARRLLRLHLSWEDARVRAERLSVALDEPEIVMLIADSMLPTFWSGSRVPHLESVLENLTDWTAGEIDGRFRQGVEAAIATFKRWIEKERERDRREEELDFWA